MTLLALSMLLGILHVLDMLGMLLGGMLLLLLLLLLRLWLLLLLL